jgi:hypothetical protein
VSDLGNAVESVAAAVFREEISAETRQNAPWNGASLQILILAVIIKIGVNFCNPSMPKRLLPQVTIKTRLFSAQIEMLLLHHVSLFGRSWREADVSFSGLHCPRFGLLSPAGRRIGLLDGPASQH